ncbi:MAG: type II secretion system F family protein [Planctomycetes bacterium]|nr:type II secretion system F family protein [Planctomycetota bacterium]
MPTFAWIARDEQGRTRKGRRDGLTDRDVAVALRGEGLLPVVVRDAAKRPWYRRPIHVFGPRPIDLEMQLRQLSFMLRTGITLLGALRVLADQGTGPSSRIWRAVGEDVRGGGTLAEALARQRCFSRLTCSLVDVGERSGNLDHVLARAAEAMARRRQTRTQVVTALAYPAIVVVLAIATVAFLVISVVPKLAKFLAGLGRQLPPSTQLLVDIANGVHAHLFTGILVLLGLIAAFVLVWATPRGRRGIEAALLRVPIVGRILALASVSAFAHNTSLLLASGVRLTSALTVVQPLLALHLVRHRVGRARERVVQGSALAESLADERAFSPLVNEMISVGETTGALDEVLDGVAQHHDETLRDLVRRLGTLVEPVLLIVIGSIVGFVYFAFFMAIYSITGVGRA